MGPLTVRTIERLLGMLAANSNAGAAVTLDSDKAIRTSSGVGTAATGVTAVEYGDGYNHVTVLTLDEVSLGTSADDAAKGTGGLLYTLPAGAILVDGARADVAVTASDAAHAAQTDVEFGLGTTVASGSVSVLGGTAAFENILIGDGALTDVDGTATEKVGMNTSGGLFIGTGGNHTVYFNVAATWVDGDAASDLTASGEVVLVWKRLK